MLKKYHFNKLVSRKLYRGSSKLNIRKGEKKFPCGKLCLVCLKIFFVTIVTLYNTNLCNINSTLSFSKCQSLESNQKPTAFVPSENLEIAVSINAQN